LQNIFCTRGRNNYDVSMSHNKRAKFCGGYCGTVDLGEMQESVNNVFVNE
jgi:hypothetical protein